MRVITSALVVLLSTIGGCAGIERPTTTVSSDALLVWSTPPPTDQGVLVILTAGLSGPLTLRDGCIRVGRSGRSIQPVWPFGTTITTSNGAISVNVPGLTGLRIGQTVEFSGGFSSEPASSAVIGKQCGSSFFYVGRVENPSE